MKNSTLDSIKYGFMTLITLGVVAIWFSWFSEATYIKSQDTLPGGDYIEQVCQQYTAEVRASEYEIQQAINLLTRNWMIDVFKTACHSTKTIFKEECSWTSWCGDAKIDRDEECDQWELNGKEWSYCTLQCTPKPIYTPKPVEAPAEFTYSYDIVIPTWAPMSAEDYKTYSQFYPL